MSFYNLFLSTLVFALPKGKEPVLLRREDSSVALSTVESFLEPNNRKGGAESQFSLKSLSILLPIIIIALIVLISALIFAYKIYQTKKKTTVEYKIESISCNVPMKLAKPQSVYCPTPNEIGSGLVLSACSTFVPSLDDEMYIELGDQVRIVMEYDDGWVLGLNLRTNEQGVLPKQCLASGASSPVVSRINSTVITDDVIMKRRSSFIN